jgi:hypothetical protein
VAHSHRPFESFVSLEISSKMELEEDKQYLECSVSDSVQASQLTSASSSSSSNSVGSIKWVDPASLGKRWKSDLWSTGLFMVSHCLIDGKRNIKCIACEQLNRVHCDWNSPKVYDGTSAPGNHAETDHSLLPKVADWLKREQARKQQIQAKQIADAQSLKKASCDDSLFLFSIFCDRFLPATCVLFPSNCAMEVLMVGCVLSRLVMLVLVH